MFLLKVLLLCFKVKFRGFLHILLASHMFLTMLFTVFLIVLFTWFSFMFSVLIFDFRNWREWVEFFGSGHWHWLGNWDRNNHFLSTSVNKPINLGTILILIFFRSGLIFRNELSWLLLILVDYFWFSLNNLLLSQFFLLFLLNFNFGDWIHIFNNGEPENIPGSSNRMLLSTNDDSKGGWQ